MAGSPAATQEIDCAQAPVDLVAEPALREPGVLADAAQNGPSFFVASDLVPHEGLHDAIAYDADASRQTARQPRPRQELRVPERPSSI